MKVKCRGCDYSDRYGDCHYKGDGCYYDKEGEYTKDGRK